MTALRRPTRLSALLVALLACAALILTGCSGSSGDSDQGFISAQPGLSRVDPAQRQAAPDITGKTLDGKQASLAALKGKVVVINVWGSWCNPCRAEADALVAAYDQTKGTADFLGINSRDLSSDTALAFVRTHKIPYPSIYDPSGAQVARFTGILPPQAIPSTLVIDAQGRVAARIIGQVTTTTLVQLVGDVAAGR